MGTNYYARIIPKKEDKQKLIDAINNNQFNVVNESAQKLFGYSNSYDINGIIHLGKRSGGWKFLWNPNVRRYIKGRKNENLAWDKSNIEYGYNYVYPLTKQGISDFLHKENIVIVSEYYHDEDNTNEVGEDIMTADEFLDMALKWCEKDGLDANKYHIECEKKGYKAYDYYDSERCEIWEELGFEVNRGSDFYSDGLRFSTSIEFG